MSIKFSNNAANQILNNIMQQMENWNSNAIKKIKEDRFSIIRGNFLFRQLYDYLAAAKVEKDVLKENVALKDLDDLNELTKSFYVDRAILKSIELSMSAIIPNVSFLESKDVKHSGFVVDYNGKPKYVFSCVLPPLMRDVVMWLWFTWLYNRYFEDPKNFRDILDTGGYRFSQTTIGAYMYFYKDAEEKFTDQKAKQENIEIRRQIQGKILCSVITTVEFLKRLYPDIYTDLSNASSKIDFWKLILETNSFSEFLGDKYYYFKPEQLYMSYVLDYYDFSSMTEENNMGITYKYIKDIAAQIKIGCIEILSKYKRTISKEIFSRIDPILKEIKFNEQNKIIYDLIKENVVTMSNMRNVMFEVLQYLKSHENAEIKEIKIESPNGNYVYTDSETPPDVVKELETLLGKTVSTNAEEAVPSEGSSSEESPEDKLARTESLAGVKKEIVNGEEHYYKARLTRSGKTLWIPSNKLEYTTLLQSINEEGERISSEVNNNMKNIQDLMRGSPFCVSDLVGRVNNLFTTQGNRITEEALSEDDSKFLADIVDEHPDEYHYERNENGELVLVRNTMEEEEDLP